MFVKLTLSILPPTSKEKGEPTEYEGINLVIASKSPAKNRATRNTPGMSSPLTRVQMQNNLTIAYDELLQILNLTVLPELGCIHSRSEWFMAMGLLFAPPEIILPCSTQ